jgi:hypothetical protein
MNQCELWLARARSRGASSFKDNPSRACAGFAEDIAGYANIDFYGAKQIF